MDHGWVARPGQLLHVFLAAWLGHVAGFGPGVSITEL
jgi:hypothetical protein